jgi:hypothetical protein
MSKLPSDLSTVATVAVDLAKHVFQVHGCDASGKVIVANALRRKDVLDGLRWDYGDTLLYPQIARPQLPAKDYSTTLLYLQIAHP